MFTELYQRLVLKTVRGKEMNKTEFIAAVASAMGSTKTDAGKAVEALTDVIKQSLRKGEEIRLIGFGSFKVQKVAAKVVRNPQNGQKINVPASKRPKFTPGKDLKDAVNK